MKVVGFMYIVRIQHTNVGFKNYKLHFKLFRIVIVWNNDVAINVALCRVIAVTWSISRVHTCLSEVINKTDVYTRSNCSLFTQMRMLIDTNVDIDGDAALTLTPFWRLCAQDGGPVARGGAGDAPGGGGTHGRRASAQTGVCFALHDRSRRVSTSPPEVEACHRALLFLQCLYWDADSGVYRSPLRQALESAGLKYNSIVILWLPVWCHDSFP